MTRRVLLVRAAAGTAILASTGAATSACGSGNDVTETTRTARQLSTLAIDAAADAAAARALVARNPDRAAALAVIATERQEHVAVLDDEIARLSPEIARRSAASRAPSPSTTPPSSEAPTGSAVPAVRTVDDLRARLQSAAKSTGDLAVGMTGYRAGMLGSIAAALGAEVTVQLA